MDNWFECKVKYDKTLDNGVNKKVSEPYLFEALSFLEVEKRVAEELQPFIGNNYTITEIKRVAFAEMFLENKGDLYYKAKVQFITLDEKSGSEKKTSVYMLVGASNIDEAHEILREGMKGTMADYVVASMVETKIVDIFGYKDNV